MIYESALKTSEVVSPSGKVVQYESAELGELEGRCWLCGCETSHGHPKKKVIKPTFTDSDFARVRWSDVVCEHCAWALSYRSLRNYSILATQDGLYHPSRAELREVFLSPPEPPFVICVAESGQPWLHYKAWVNMQATRFVVRFEHVDVRVRPDEFGEILEPIEELYKEFSKDEIRSGGYKAHRIQKFGLERWEELEREVSRYRGTRIFELALFVAQNEEKE